MQGGSRLIGDPAGDFQPGEPAGPGRDQFPYMSAGSRPDLRDFLQGGRVGEVVWLPRINQNQGALRFRTRETRRGPAPAGRAPEALSRREIRKTSDQRAASDFSAINRR